jgi:hypothetical protein
MTLGVGLLSSTSDHDQGAEERLAWSVRAVTLKGLFVCLGGVMGALKYAIIGAVAIVVVVIALALVLPTLHQAPVHYFGSPSGYEAFVPNGQTINYNGHTDPTGTLILNNGTKIKN